MLNTKPFYRSKTIVTAIISVTASFIAYATAQAQVEELSPFVSDNLVEILVAINAVTAGFETWFRSVADTKVVIR